MIRGIKVDCDLESKMSKSKPYEGQLSSQLPSSRPTKVHRPIGFPETMLLKRSLFNSDTNGNKWYMFMH